MSLFPRRRTIAQRTWVETVTRRGPEPILAHQVGVMDYLARLATGGHNGRVLWGLSGQGESTSAADFAPLQKFNGAAANIGHRTPVASNHGTALPSTSAPPGLSPASAVAAKIGAGTQ